MVNSRLVSFVWLHRVPVTCFTFQELLRQGLKCYMTGGVLAVFVLYVITKGYEYQATC